MITDKDQRRLTIQLPIDRIAGCLVMCVAPCLISDDSFPSGKDLHDDSKAGGLVLAARLLQDGADDLGSVQHE